MINSPEMKKIFIVGVLLLVLLVAGLVIRNKKPMVNIPAKTQPTEEKTIVIPIPTVASFVGIYKIVPSAAKVKQGEKISLPIYFSAPGKILNGADVVLHFDPSFLVLDEIIQGEHFSLFPRREIDNKQGFAKITGFLPKEEVPLQNEVLFVSLTFTAQKQGVSRIEFAFEKSKTNLSTLIERGTSKNILERAEGAEITVE